MVDEILIAEDNDDVRRFLRTAFRDHYRVETVSDGHAAWEYVTERSDHPPDAVLLDVMMPGIDGFTLLERLRDRPAFADIPVLIVSGRSREEDVQRAIELGATDFVTKPFDPRKLRTRVARAVDPTALH